MSPRGEREPAAPLTSAELEELPIFPLPRIVFFPGTTLPLHLFEPRYRRLIEDCMSRGPRVLAVAQLAEGWEADYEGRPAIHPIAGAGRIVDHRRNPDGTHDVVLAGVSRVCLRELPEDGLPYRRARAEAVIDPLEAEVPESDIRALFACASQIAGRVQQQHPQFSLGVEPTDPPGVIADTIADRLIADYHLRQIVLETLDLGERIRRVTDLVGELLARITPHTLPS